MSPPLIRVFQDEDYDEVREVYSTGFGEHLNAVCIQTLRQTWVQLALLVFLWGVSSLSGSLSFAGVSTALLVLAGREGVRYLFNQGIRLGLREDLLDVRASYMQEGAVSCFWVAESQGRVVGTVAILPAPSQPGAWELKRISVRREVRGRGIAMALCGTALAFAAARGVKDIVLYTSMLQTDAHKLYHRMGFHKIEEFLWPSLPARLINFMVYKYGYRVHAGQEAHSENEHYTKSQ
ncbi:probable N-acetyltransferase camello [Osmerus eperlanus]|uniref:probable N-acetyltransferase camello n=1 Tax=Osmerus eperlanus TaxID=29151 RepID=UPI002E13FAD6